MNTLHAVTIQPGQPQTTEAEEISLWATKSKHEYDVGVTLDQPGVPVAQLAQPLALTPLLPPRPQEDIQAPTERQSCARQSEQLVGHCSRYLIACCCISASAVFCAGITSAGLYLIGAATLPISKACLIGECGSGCTCCGCQKELFATIHSGLRHHGINASTSRFLATSAVGACCATGAVIPLSVCCSLSDQ